MSSKNQIAVSVAPIGIKNGPSNVFTWDGRLNLNVDHVDEENSRKLFGQTGVLAVLQRAFEMGLSRDIVWDISAIDSQDAPAFRMAASVFKRGVSLVDNRLPEELPGYRGSAFYKVKIVSDMAGCFPAARSRDIVIVDRNVVRSWWHQLPSGFVEFSFEENQKNIAITAAVVDLIRTRLRNGSRVIVVGGGVAGDIVGFAAGVLGVPCHYVPTTLLSMVDSSIGGKVGVNFPPWGKNQIGLFRAPLAVSIWPGWLSTLDPIEIKSGLAEALKHALVAGRMDLWTRIVLVQGNPSDMAEMILDIIGIKRDIVERDPFEMDERAVLNFGHTLGHALETYASTRAVFVTHGECVAVGMIHALRLSAKYRAMEIETLLKDILGVGVVMPKSKLKQLLGDEIGVTPFVDVLVSLMAGDKKSVAAGGVPFVLLDSPGNVARAKDKRWVIQFPVGDVKHDLEETLNFMLNLSY